MLRVIAIVVTLATCPAAWARGEPIVTTDLPRLRTVTDIDVSRDGGRAVFAVKSIVTLPPVDLSQPGAEPTYKYQTHLFALELGDATSQPRQLTFGDRNDSSPELSPDGRRVAFVRESERPVPVTDQSHPTPRAEHSPQIWILNLDGGEARQLTAFEHGAGDPMWSPDGQSLLISTAVPLHDLEGAPAWPMERPNRLWKDAELPANVQPRPDGTREQIRAWLERNAELANPSVINRIEFQDEHSLRGSMSFVHLFLLGVEGATDPVPITAARRITSGFADHLNAAFMPDGQSVVYAAKKPANEHVDRVLATSLWRVNIDGTNDHEMHNLQGWSLDSPKPSRDGLAVAFTAQQIDEPAFRQTQIGMIAAAADGATEPVWLTDEATFQGSVFDFEWIPTQSAAIAFSTGLHGGFPLMTVNAGLVQPAPLIASPDNGKQIGVNAFALGGGSIVFSQTSVTQPCVLHVKDARGDRAVYDLNPWVAGKTLSLPSEGWVTRPDGVRVQYWVMEPTGREQGQKYPLACEMHGGPAAIWGPGEVSMWHEFQLLCSWGYGVVYCNPRGSGGYGYQFQKGNFQNWGDGPGNDVLAVVDQAALLEWVDRDKLVITGGSYAGYLTAWIVAHDHRFKAAVAQRGVYDFDTFYGEGNAWRLVAWAMGGSPIDPRTRQVLDRNNIMSHVSRIKTPLLIKHGSSDLRTGVAQSEMLYRALKDLGRPVEYVRYPNAGHDLSRLGDPWQRMDRLDRIIEFFERYVDNPRPAPVVSGQ
jgi:dipeptidyl aminopeptidase/acylaminoacyl peptidase